MKRKNRHAKQSKQETNIKHNAKSFPQITRRKDVRRWMTPLWIISGVLLALAGLLCTISLSHFKYTALWIAFVGTVFATAAVFVWLHATIAEHDKDKTPPEKLDKQPASPLETSRPSNKVTAAHKITSNAFEIIGHINSVGPLQKEDVINSYIGGAIDWKVGFHSIREIKGDREHIEAKFIPVAIRPPVHPFIVCVVSRKEYAYLDKDTFKPPSPVQVFRLTGIVSEIDPEGAATIKIDNAVAAHLDASEKTTAQLNPVPRDLTGAQLSSFTGILQEAKGQRVVLFRTAADGNTIAFTEQVKGAVEACGLTVTGTTGSTGGLQMPTGVAIALPINTNSKYSKQLVPTIQRAFRTIGIDAPIVDTSKFPYIIPSPEDVTIIISESPQFRL